VRGSRISTASFRLSSLCGVRFETSDGDPVAGAESREGVSRAAFLEVCGEGALEAGVPDQSRMSHCLQKLTGGADTRSDANQ